MAGAFVFLYVSVSSVDQKLLPLAFSFSLSVFCTQYA